MDGQTDGWTDGQTDGWTDGQGDSYIPPQTLFAGGIKTVISSLLSFCKKLCEVWSEQTCHHLLCEKNAFYTKETTYLCYSTSENLQS